MRNKLSNVVAVPSVQIVGPYSEVVITADILR